MRALGIERRTRKGRGQALVEFAFVLPIFLLIIMVLFDFGRVIYAQHTIDQDASEGARKGAVSADTLATSTDFTNRYQAIRDAALAMAPAVPISNANVAGAAGACSLVDTATTGTPDMPDDPVVASACFYPNGIVNSHVNVAGQFDYPPKIVVKITASVSLITPIISNILGGSIPITATSEQLLQ